MLAIHETRDGYLWLGTECCLVRFDGERFTQYENDKLGLKQHSFGRALLETEDRSLWAALVGGVARYSNNRFDWYAEAAGLSHPFVYALAPRTGNSVWAATGGAGIWGFEKGRFAPHPAYVVNLQLPAKVNDLETDAQGTLWAATDEGVLSLGDPVRKFSTESGLPSEVANAILFDRRGRLWVGTREGLAHLEGEGNLRFEVTPGLDQADIAALLEDRDQVIWVGARDGLYRKSGDTIVVERSDRGGVMALAEDHLGSLWVGTAEGLERYRDGAFSTLGKKEGLSNEQILNVVSRRKGGLWVLDGSGAIWIEQDGQQLSVTPPGTIAGSGMLGLAESVDGSLWVAARELMRWHDGTWSHYAHDGGDFSVVMPDGDGMLVAQTHLDGTSTLSRLHDGQFAAVPIGSSLRHVQRLFRDRSGCLWISTGGDGLIRVGPQGTRVFQRVDGLPHDIVYGVAEDAQGTLWVATRGGLARIRGDRVVSLARAQGVPNRSPVHVHLDGLGQLWVTADDGIHCLSVAELNRIADGASNAAVANRFTTRDGLRSAEVSWRCSAQAVLDDGRLYYATARGLAVIDPRSVVRDATPPRTRIELVSLAGRPIEPTAQVVNLVDRRDRLEIRYSCPALLAPNGVEFRYRLEGYEKDWVLAGSSRVAHYVNLPAGDYAFSVGARHLGGSWLETPPSVRLHVSPKWYETGPVRLLMLFAVGLLGYGVHRIKLLRLKQNERVLTAKVFERTEELRQEIVERRAAEALARDLANQLEVRVQQRTAELELANMTARRYAERYDLAVRGAQDGLWDLDLVTGSLYLSPRWKAMLGYTDHELNSTVQAWLTHVHAYDVSALRQALEPKPGSSGQFRLEYRMLDRAGSELWVLCRGIILFDANGNPVRAAGSQSDITQHKSLEAELRRNATRDALTGLPNRSLFADRLRQAVLRAKLSGGHPCAVLFLDIDHFKDINDTMGHAAGDQLLIAVAGRISSTLRETETAARLGGDEFAVLLPEVPDESYPTDVAERIQESLAAPIAIDDASVTVAASIGIKLGFGGNDELKNFMRDADMAMYHAKAEGRGRYQTFQSSMRDEAIERARIEAGLRVALEHGHLLLHYQPLVSLTTGEAVGVEALVRWDDPERGLIPPDVFIGVAETSGLITPLSEWVLAAACAQAQHWKGRWKNPVRIAMNVPPSLLNDTQFVSKVESQLQHFGLSGTALGIELVETSVVDTHAAVLENLNRLRSMGVSISIDDFGTGYSSFGYLKRLPISYLKIDRSLTQNTPVDANDTAICKAILAMSVQLGLVAVVEGVETREQVDFLRDNGCGVVQGYYFSRPLPADECTEYLDRSLTCRSIAPRLQLVRKNS